MQNWRTHVSFRVSRSLLLRSRSEICLFSNKSLSFPETGYLIYVEGIFKPVGQWYSGNLRIQAFESGGYETRIYAYENDLLYVSSTPSFFNTGIRYYLNLKGKFRIKELSNRQLTISFKAATTVYKNISTIGSGVNGISGARRSDLRLQVLLAP
jgi:hypothetical protein